MQAGTRRRRSDSSNDHPGPSKRPRDTSPISTEISSTLQSDSAIHSRSPPVMSRSFNGHTADDEGAVAGPSSGNGHPRVPPLVDLEGTLMYPDDKDWVANDDGDDGMIIDDEDEGRMVSASRRHVGLTGAQRMPVNREEVTRLMLQALRDIGYHESANTLEAESGYVLSSQPAHDFQAAVLGGRWSEALALLPQLGIRIPAATTAEPVISSSSSIASGKSKVVVASGKGTPVDRIRFLISQQKYLEMLEMGVQKKALAVLRNELAPVAKDSEILHALSGFMMCMDKEDLYDRAQWDGAAGTSRRRLLEQIQTFISPRMMLPPRRLATLLEQARRQQQQSCRYHTSSEPSSLYTDHQCASGLFPSETSHILVDHGDEVHNLAWSPDGSMLATAGHDKMVVIWRLEITPKASGGEGYDMIPLHQLKDHRESVGALAWSPDSNILVTAADRSVYMWDVKTGNQITMSSGSGQHTDEISAIRWRPDGSEFLVSSMDCKLIFYSAKGETKRKWSTPILQFRDFVITPDGSRLIAATAHVRRHIDEPKPKPSMSGRAANDPSNGIVGGLVQEFGYEEMDHGIVVIVLADKKLEAAVPVMGSGISSISLSADGKRFLINVEDDDVMLFSTEPTVRLIKKFSGHIHSRFLIRSCFGPPKDRYILSGSEDGAVYVWDANSGKAISVLHGHQDTVNAVAWNPISSRRLWASCSDDHQVRIWQPPATEESGESRMKTGEEIEGDTGLVL